MKSIFSVPNIIISLLVIFLYSCNDNPADQNQNTYAYDLPRFDWQVTFLPGGDWIYSLWSPDTNEVFMTSWYNHLLHFKDGEITQINYGPNIKIACIDGLSKNEGYIVGSVVLNGRYLPHIERWNGNAFSNVPVNYSYNDDFFVSHIFVKSSTEIWISSPKGLIYNFDGYNLTQYRLPDTTLISFDILNDEYNKIRYLAANFDSVLSNDKYYVFEFDGNIWSKVHENKGIIHYGVINNMIYAIDQYVIYKLENNALVEKVRKPVNGAIDVIAGNTFENIMGFGRTNGKSTFFHWNGQKWSNENIGYKFITDELTRKMISNNYFCAVNSGFIETTILYRAYKKQ